MLLFVITTVLVLVGCGTPTPLVETPRSPGIVTQPTRPAQIEQSSQPPVVSKSEFWADLPPGIIDGRSHFEASNVTEWTFANGARVVLRPSQSEPRRVFLLAFAEGGLTDLASDRAVSAVLAARAVGAGMTPGGVRVESFFTNDLAIVAGDASTETLGALLRRATSLMTATEPVIDSPTLRLQEALSLLVSGHPETSLAAPIERSEGMDAYAEQFGDPRRFTYIIVGDVIPSEVEAQTATVLTSTRPSARAVLGISASGQPARLLGVVARWTMNDVGGLASFGLGFRSAVDANYENLAALEIVAELLSRRIQSTTGKQVVVDVDMDFDNDSAELQLDVSGAGVDGEDFQAAEFDAIQSLRDSEPTTQLMTEARSAVHNAHEESIQTNAGWFRWLVRLFRFNQDTREALRYGQRIRGTSAARVHAMALAVLDLDHYALVIQRSE